MNFFLQKGATFLNTDEALGIKIFYMDLPSVFVAYFLALSIELLCCFAKDVMKFKISKPHGKKPTYQGK